MAGKVQGVHLFGDHTHCPAVTLSPRAEHSPCGGTWWEETQPNAHRYLLASRPVRWEQSTHVPLAPIWTRPMGQLRMNLLLSFICSLLSHPAARGVGLPSAGLPGWWGGRLEESGRGWRVWKPAGHWICYPVCYCSWHWLMWEGLINAPTFPWAFWREHYSERDLPGCWFSKSDVGCGVCCYPIASCLILPCADLNSPTFTVCVDPPPVFAGKFLLSELCIWILPLLQKDCK